MKIIASGFFLGAFLLQGFTYLPSLSVLLSLLVVILLIFISTYYLNTHRYFVLIIKPFSVFLLSVFVSLIYTTINAQSIIDTRLQANYIAKDLIVEGVIANIPQQKQNRWRFYLDVSHAAIKGKKIKLTGKLKLSWYHRKHRQSQTLVAGQTWRFKVRLKQPNGFRNEGSFDYEKWLFTNRVRATGYVREATENTVLSHAPWYSLHFQRQQLVQKINQLLGDDPANAIITALAVADRSKINASQWKLFQQTGTSHLIAISGLHIGIVAGLGYLLVAVFWWLFPTLYQRVPVRIAGAFLAILLATLYAFLAGFSLPTQRSLVMVVGVVIALLQRQRIMTLNIIAIALVIVLLIDPFATMSASFWLSFTAEILILLYVSRRKKKSALSFVSLQLMLSFGMFPLTIFFFGGASLISPLANLIAIPWVTVVIVPLILLSLLFLFIAPILSQFLLQFVVFNIEYLLHVLAWLDALPLTMLDLNILPIYLILLMMLALLFLFLPKGFPARWLGILLFIPLLCYQPPSIQQHGVFTYILLDTGQGLASIVQTKQHRLIYDTGAKTNKDFDTGKLVVLPFLQVRGIQHIDKMVLSHNDIDHNGGTLALLKAIRVDEIISSNTQFLPNYAIKKCQAGQQWQWDGVHFEFLHPSTEGKFSGEGVKDNNRSCVLRVSNQYHSLLLTADIEKEVELSLLKNIPDKLKSEVLLIPHHGSLTSSTERFIDQVDPKLGVNSFGYHNKFKHPMKKVMQRYQRRGIPVYDTVKKGQISLFFPADHKPLRIRSYREENLKFWHRR